MSKKTPKPQALTANFLTNGTVVYLDGAGNWSNNLKEAHITSNPDELSHMTHRGNQGVANNIVNAPYLIEMEQTPTGWKASHIKEHIRTQGPTIDYLPN